MGDHVADRIYQPKTAMFWELLASEKNQAAGGGRMNCVAVGRKIVESSATELDSTDVAKAGASVAVVVLSPA